MSDIFNFLNQENEEGLQNMSFDSLEGLHKTSLATIKTHKTIRKISNEIAMNSPFGRRSEFYRPEYVYKNIDFVKLSELISNRKDAIFNWEHYIGSVTKTIKKNVSFGEEAKFDRMAGIPTSYTETVTVKRENPLKENTVSGERVLDLNARLNKEIGLVNIHKDSPSDRVGNIEFDFDYKERKVAYKLHYYYDGYKRVKEKDNKGEIAFTISSAKYDDFDAFLKHSKIRIAPERLETFQNEIISTFKNAITEMDNYMHFDRRLLINYKYGNLQWIYERIPYFVGQHLDFENTLKIVLELSSWDKGSATIDTTKSILKALRILNPFTVYDHFNKNPQKIIDLFKGFQDDSSVEQFCTFLTAIVLLIKGDNFSEDKARVFELSDNKHIETNILEDDDRGKVELVNEQDRPFNFFTFNFWETFLDDEINNPNNASNQFHPLDIIYLSHYDETLQENVKIPTIAIYAKYLGDKGEWADVLTATFAVIDVISIVFSGGALAAGVRGVARVFAIADITISTINLITLSPAVKQALSRTEAGKWFVTHWPIISFCLSAGMLSHYLAKGILKYGKTVKKQLKNNPKLSKQIDELIEESKKVGGHSEGRSIVVTSDPIKVKAFEENYKKLDKLYRTGKLTGKNAIDYLEDAMPYFNHKVVDGEVIQISFTNCGNTVKVLDDFLKTGRIVPAAKSGLQSTEAVATKFKAGLFLDVEDKIIGLERLNNNTALIADGKNFILYGITKKTPVKGRNGKIGYNMEGHYMYGIKRNKNIYLYDPQTGRFAIFNRTRGSNFMKILMDQWGNIVFREGYQYLKIK